MPPHKLETQRHLVTVVTVIRILSRLKLSNPVHEIRPKVIQEENKSIPHCKAMCENLTDGQMKFTHWIYVLLQVHFWRRSHCRWNRIREERQTVVDPHGGVHADTSMRTKRADNNSIQITMESDTQRKNWFDSRLAQNKGLVFWQTITDATMSYASMPAACLAEVVRRNLDDTEAEILSDKAEPFFAYDVREILAIIEQGEVHREKK